MKCFYHVVRLCSLPEDEGLGRYLGRFETKEKALEFVDQYTEDGYFNGCMQICTEWENEMR
jgi:hypothetical protein